MAGEGWEAERMFELYVHDYMMRKNMHKTAASFKREANLPDHDCIVIDSPDGFLHEWWSIFSEVYLSKKNQAEESYQAMQIEEVEQQQQHHCSVELEADIVPYQQIPMQSPRIDDFENLLETPAAIYSEIETSFSPVAVNKLKLSRPVATTSSSMAPQTFEMVRQVNSIDSARSGSMLSAFQNGISSTLGPHQAEMSNGVDKAPLNGWPGNAYNNQEEQIRSPLFTSSTSENQTSSPSDFCSSDPKLIRNETKGNNDQTTVLPIQTVEQQNQYEQPQRQPFRKGRKRKGQSNLRTEENLIINDGTSGEENVNCVISQGGDIINSPSVTKCHPSFSAENKNQGLNLEEVNCIRTSKKALSCCRFSLDGKMLAFAGPEGKVFIWNVEARYCFSNPEQHSRPITDLQFRPMSSTYATSSHDKTVKIWDASRPKKTYSELCGHSGAVMSLDFHPRKTDILCSCDSNDEIRMWSLFRAISMRTFKGATKQVRFQPNFERLLATASGNRINLFDIESSILLLSYSGHITDVLSISWDSSGQYLLSVSEESARLWSMKMGGQCIHELSANEKKFRSCTFHPGYQNIGIIGGYKSLELWSPTNGRGILSIPAHEGLVTSLAQVGETSMIASASDDCCEKMWK